MKNEARQKTVEGNSRREAAHRAKQSAQKPVAGQAPLKEHGQPAWREVKPE